MIIRPTSEFISLTFLSPVPEFFFDIVQKNVCFVSNYCSFTGKTYHVLISLSCFLNLTQYILLKTTKLSFVTTKRSVVLTHFGVVLT